MESRADRRSYFGLSCMLALLLLFAAAKATVWDTLDPDCFWHLRVGEQLWREGVHPLIDHLSFASQKTPWTPYSWLAEMGMAWLWNAGGWQWAVAFTALMSAGILGAVAYSCRQLIEAREAPGAQENDRLLPTLLATTFAAILSLSYFSFRPVTIAVFLLAICAALLLRDRRLHETSRAVWMVVPLTILTANVHLFAFFVPMSCAALLIGAIIERFFKTKHALLLPLPVFRGRVGVGASRSQFSNLKLQIQTAPSLALPARHCSPQARSTEGEEKKKGETSAPLTNRAIFRLLLLTAASGLACLCTPMLPGAMAAAIHYQWHDPMVASTVIGEMQPFYAGTAGQMSALLVISLAACVIRKPCIRAGEMIWLAMATILLMRLGRFSPLFVLIAAPVLAVTMPMASDAVFGRRSIQLASVAVLCMGVCRVAFLFPSGQMNMDTWANRHGETVAGYPAEAAEFVRSHMPPASGRIINEFNWGGYLEWKFAGRYQMLLDGRTQVFSNDFWRQTYLTDDDTRRRFLSTVDADAAILPVSKSLFRPALLQLGWKVVHRDDRAEVLTPPTSSLATIDDR